MADLDEEAMIEIEVGDGEGAMIKFDFNGRRISVSIFASSSSGDRNQHSIQDHIIQLLDRSTEEDLDADEYDEIEDEVLGVILEAGSSIFEALAPRHVEHDASQNLHSFIYPTTLCFKLLDKYGKAVIVPINPSEAYNVYVEQADRDSDEEYELDIDPTLPCYSTNEIFIAEVFAQRRRYTAGRVLVNGEEMFCKARGNAAGLIGTSVGRELQCLQKLNILAPFYHDTIIRIPRLLGYVRHADTNRLVGFVRQWVPGRRLTDVDVPATQTQRNQKWISQIYNAALTLHNMGMIWGNGKAENVIIDERDDAYLIDFGIANLWLHANCEDLVECDLQGLESIGDFLSIW